MGEVGMI